MHKKFELKQTKIKGGCQSGRKVVTHNSKNDLPLRRRHTERSERSCFEGVKRPLLHVLLSMMDDVNCIGTGEKSSPSLESTKLF